MSKKRRADGDLDRNEPALSTAVEKPPCTKTKTVVDEGHETSPAELLPHAPVENEENGEKVVIEGQTGIVILPKHELDDISDNEADLPETTDAGRDKAEAVVKVTEGKCG